MKKTVIFILSFIILISLTSFALSAEELLWTVSPMGELHLIGNCAIPDYEKGSAPWMSEADRIGAVVINGGIYSIGENAFSGLTLESVTLAGSVSYIADSAFDSYDIFFNTVYDSYAYNFVKQRAALYDCGGLHIFTGWKQVKPATYTETGVQKRGCMRCFTEESMETGVLAPPQAKYVISGSTVTLQNLYGVKDIFFAKGTQTTYRDVKNNLIYSLTSAKINENNEFTYTLRTSGMHTVYIRHNDGRADERLYININVTEPEFSYGNGTLTVSNIEDAKVIRVAEGEHGSVASMKASGSIVNYTGRIIRQDSYTIRFKHNGVYTIAVEYNSGYTFIYKWPVYGVL